jgi:hypothetical protein
MVGWTDDGRRLAAADSACTRYLAASRRWPGRKISMACGLLVFVTALGAVALYLR